MQIVPSDPSIEYQYGWWIYPPQDDVDNNRHFSARGNLGQFIYVAPEERLVIVRHGYDFGNVNWINLFGSIVQQLPNSRAPIQYKKKLTTTQYELVTNKSINSSS